MTEEIREVITSEKLNETQLVDEVMKVLKHSDNAAYRVFLLLSKRFGAGQRI